MVLPFSIVKLNHLNCKIKQLLKGLLKYIGVLPLNDYSLVIFDLNFGMLEFGNKAIQNMKIYVEYFTAITCFKGC